MIYALADDELYSGVRGHRNQPLRCRDFQRDLPHHAGDVSLWYNLSRIGCENQYLSGAPTWADDQLMWYGTRVGKPPAKRILRNGLPWPGNRSWVLPRRSNGTSAFRSALRHPRARHSPYFCDRDKLFKPHNFTRSLPSASWAGFHRNDLFINICSCGEGGRGAGCATNREDS